MADETPKPEELIQIDHRPPKADWMEVPVNIRKGMYCYASNPKSVEYVGLPHARAWNPLEDDWKLPENWQDIFLEGLRERIDRFRSLKIFMECRAREWLTPRSTTTSKSKGFRWSSKNCCRSSILISSISGRFLNASSSSFSSLRIMECKKPTFIFFSSLFTYETVHRFRSTPYGLRPHKQGSPFQKP